MSETRNARISSTHFGREDHGIPTAYIAFEGDGWGQSFGGYDLRDPDRADFCIRVLDTLRVSTWEKLPGTICRVRTTHSKMLAIGHAIEERWYEPEAATAQQREGGQS